MKKPAERGSYYLYWRGPDSGNAYQIIPAAKYTGLTMTTYELLTDCNPGSENSGL